MFRTAVILALVFIGSGCAKAPIVKATAPNYFMGFIPPPADQGRVLLWREYHYIGSGVPWAIEIGDCHFEIGTNQFAVCAVEPGRVEIRYANGFDWIDVPGSGWVCIAPEGRSFEEVFVPIDCRKLMIELDVYRQVWTTQIPRDQILDKIPTRSSSRPSKTKRGAM